MNSPFVNNHQALNLRGFEVYHRNLASSGVTPAINLKTD